MDLFHLEMDMPSCGLLIQQDAWYLVMRQGQFVPPGSWITQTNLETQSKSLDGRDFFCQMDRFPDVPGRRSLEVRRSCAVQGM